MRRRRTMIAFAVLAFSAAATPASAGSLRLQQLGLGSRPAVTSAEAGDVALARDGMLHVYSRENARRVYPIPSRCDATAIHRAAVALGCYFPATGDTPYLLDRSSGAITPVKLPFENRRAEISALGAHWALVDASSNPPDGIHGDDRRILLNPATGESVDLSFADPFGSRRYLDLDAERPARALCRPITRSRYSNTSQVVLKRRPMARSGRWFLEHDSTGIAELQRCGRSTQRRFANEAGAVLGDGVVGYMTKRSRPRIVLETLYSSRRWSAPRPTGTDFVLTAAGRRLIISAQTPGGPYAVYSATIRP